MKPARSLARSLKARALQLLSQREQSRVELRRKLLAFLKADAAKAAAASARVGTTAREHEPGARPSDSAGPASLADLADPAGSADLAETADPADPADPASQVEAVLDWLAAHQFSSDERFAESRVHARSGRYGNLRIRQELKQHAVVLAPEATQALEESEEARAISVYRRRFGAPAGTAAERAKRARFLSARGFSPEVVRRVLRGAEDAGGRDG